MTTSGCRTSSSASSSTRTAWDVIASAARRRSNGGVYVPWVGHVSRTALFRYNLLVLSTVTMRRSLAARGFPEDTMLAGLEDYCLWLDLADAGARIVATSDVVAIYDDAGPDRLSRAASPLAAASRPAHAPAVASTPPRPRCGRRRRRPLLARGEAAHALAPRRVAPPSSQASTVGERALERLHPPARPAAPRSGSRRSWPASGWQPLRRRVHRAAPRARASRRGRGR